MRRRGEKTSFDFNLSPRHLWLVCSAARRGMEGAYRVGGHGVPVQRGEQVRSVYDA